MNFTPLTPRKIDDQSLSDLSEFLYLRKDHNGVNPQKSILEICFLKAVEFIETETGRVLTMMRWSARGDLDFPISVDVGVSGTPKIVSVRSGELSLSPADFWVEREADRYTVCAHEASLSEGEIVIALGNEWPELDAQLRWLVLATAAHFFQNRLGEAPIPNLIKAEITRLQNVRIGFSA